MARAWPALDIHLPGCDPQLLDLVLAELDDFQPTAIQDPADTQPLRAFFTTADARDRAAHALRAAFGSHLFVESTDIADENWAERSQAALQPVCAGRITVAPPWAVTAADADRIEVVIQPSMGFGTGHHATTRLMLCGLQGLHVRGLDVLDIGCGSGVLAIAAVLLGARSALGVDNDPDALASAAGNVQLNGVSDRVRLLRADLRELTSPADIVLANLTGSLLERSAGTLAALVAPAGHLIVSGLMESESRVIPALETFLTLEQVDQEDEWRCAVLRKDHSHRR